MDGICERHFGKSPTMKHPTMRVRRADTSKLGLPSGACDFQYLWIVQGSKGVLLCNDTWQHIAVMQGSRCTLPVHVTCAHTGVLRWVEHEVSEERIRNACGSAVDVVYNLLLDRRMLPRLQKLTQAGDKVGAWSSGATEEQEPELRNGPTG